MNRLDRASILTPEAIINTVSPKKRAGLICQATDIVRARERASHVKLGRQIPVGVEIAEARNLVEEPVIEVSGEAEVLVGVWPSDPDVQSVEVIPGDDGKDYDPLWADQSIKLAGRQAYQDGDFIMEERSLRDEQLADYAFTRQDQG